MQVDHLISFIAFFLLGLGIIKLKKPFFSFALASTAQLNVLLDNSLDEDAKQKLLIHNLKNLLFELFRIILLLVLVGLVAYAPVYGYEQFLNDGTPYDTSSVIFYAVMVIGSIIPFFVFKAKQQGDYSDWSKLLHRLVLDNYYLSKTLFGLDKRSKHVKPENIDPNFLVVTGLARAGTTAMTNMLFKTERFYSLSYANMPFLLAPNLWKRFYNPKNLKLKERAHGDQVLFGLDSIEALEEYFFKAHLNDVFIKEDRLVPYAIDKELNKQYGMYRQLVKPVSDKQLYLAKNNNLMLRYTSMRELNADFKVILMFREPLAHAESLMKQHQRFTKIQEEDPFSQEYMNWLAHHEFGLNHKPFEFSGEELPTVDQPNELAYWVNIWIAYYTYVLSLKHSENTLLVHYEDLLNTPEGLMKAIGDCWKIDLKMEIEKFNKTDTKAPSISSEQLKRANAIYEKLLNSKLSI